MGDGARESVWGFFLKISQLLRYLRGCLCLATEGGGLATGAAQRLSLTGLELCSPVCSDTRSFPGAARISFSLVLLQQASPLQKMRSVSRGEGNVIFKEILDSLMKLLFRASSNGK